MFNPKQGLRKQQFETSSFWEEGVLEVVKLALNLSDDMQFVVLDFGVETLLVGQELGLEVLVHDLKHIVSLVVLLRWACVGS